MNRKDTEYIRLLVASLWECTNAEQMTHALYYSLETYMSGVAAGKFATARSRWTCLVLTPSIKEITETSIQMAKDQDDSKYKETFEQYAVLLEKTGKEFTELQFGNFTDPEM